MRGGAATAGPETVSVVVSRLSKAPPPPPLNPYPGCDDIDPRCGDSIFPIDRIADKPIRLSHNIQESRSGRVGHLPHQGHRDRSAAVSPDVGAYPMEYHPLTDLTLTGLRATLRDLPPGGSTTCLGRVPIARRDELKPWRTSVTATVAKSEGAFITQTLDAVSEDYSHAIRVVVITRTAV